MSFYNGVKVLEEFRLPVFKCNYLLDDIDQCAYIRIDNLSNGNVHIIKVSFDDFDKFVV